MRWAAILLSGMLTLFSVAASAGDGNRLAYLDECDPYYPHRDFARLTTPQWVGESGVEAVVILAIDDMRDPAKYEAFLRPILDRLKQIDGRAPLSIMTNKVDPNDPQLQAWHKEGVSIECHTLDHPCPLLTEGDFAKASATYHGCVDLMTSIPWNPPVAFRMPCCDSLNTVSPRFFAEIFNKQTPGGSRLSIDSSVFNILTPNDPELPRELVYEPGTTKERFRKYLPFPSFVNTIENYPYPYVINGTCWEFPCVVPSDWEAQNIQQPNNPKTVEDLKAALDAVVIKQGVYNLVFHPHGWIRAEQVVELIDYAVAKHGNKVKFMSFWDAHFALCHQVDEANADLSEDEGTPAGTVVLDINSDGFMDVFAPGLSRTWNPRGKLWEEATTDFRFPDITSGRCRFGVLTEDGRATLVHHSLEHGLRMAEFKHAWPHAKKVELAEDDELPKELLSPGVSWLDHRLRDLDCDGICELLITPEQGDVVLLALGKDHRWRRLPFTLPVGAAIVDAQKRDAGLRFIDIDEDGDLDALFSNESQFSLHLFESIEKGWSREILRGKPGDERTIPPIVRNGTNNGAWFHSRHLWVQNEDTARLPDLVDRRSFNELLGNADLGPRSPDAALESFRVRPGLKVELVAAEPLVMDPVGFDWGADGKLWVVEMGDYPLGADNQGRPGGRVRYLEDTDGDGSYDRSTLFLDGLSYPNGVMAWQRGVLVSAAPEVFYAEDTDGDGRADKRESLLTGFGEANPQHRVNGFTWGLDNWVHCAMGESGGDIHSVKGNEDVDLGNRDFRFHPRTGELDPQTGVTQFQRVADDWGNWFGSDNIHPLWHYCLADEYLRRNPHVGAPRVLREVPEVPGAAPIFPTSRTLARFNDFHLSNHITSACGVTFYRDELLGADLSGNSFVCEPVHNLVHREVLSADGASFVSRRPEEEKTSEFLASTDNWFRPVMARTGPDGALYIADFYRQVLEHPEWIPDDIEAKIDVRAGQDQGRIYRIVPVAGELRDVPKLSEQTTSELVANLESPNGTLRDMTQRLLVERQEKRAIEPLRKLAIDAERHTTRMQALCTLDGLKVLDEATVVTALRDQHPQVRRHALRLSEPFLKDDGPVRREVMSSRWFSWGEDDGFNRPKEDPAVSMQYACTIGALPPEQAALQILSMALRVPDDSQMRSAIASSITKENLPTCVEMLVQIEYIGPVPKSDYRAYPLRLFAEMAAAYDDLASCSKVLDGALREDSIGDNLVRTAGVLAALRSHGLSADDLNQDTPGDSIAKLKKMAQSAATTLASNEAPIASRLAALEIISHVESDSGLAQLAEVLTPSAPAELREAAITRLASMDSDVAFATLMDAWRSFTPQVRGIALDACFQRPKQVPRVLAALEAGQIQSSDFDADRRQRFAIHAGTELRARVVKALSAEIETDRRQVVEQFGDVLQFAANAEHGAEVFKGKCAVCHRLGNVGFAIGADLAALTDKSPRSMLVAILDPNRALETKFVSYTAQTTAGLTHTGMLIEESGASITLQGQEDKRQVIPRSELEACESTGKSLMPEGLEKDLSKQDLADVMAFVANLPTPHKEFPGNAPATVQADENGTLKLTAVRAEIFGPTMIFESGNQNLGFWGSEADRAAWNVHVQTAGRYRVWLHYACHDDTAGNAFQIQCGEQRLASQVIGTGTWDYYRREPLGELELSLGDHRVTIRSDGPIAGHLMDLFELSLEPVEGK